MSINRLNTILMSNILPFNFGMTYNCWLSFWKNTDNPEGLLTDPNEWSEDIIKSVNETADKENKVYEYLMSLPEKEFHIKLDQLQDKCLEEICKELNLS